MDQREQKRLQVLGVRVSMFRKLKGYTIEQLAEKVERSPTLLQKLEAPNTAVSISLRTLFRICDALDITPSKLFDGLDD